MSIINVGRRRSGPTSFYDGETYTPRTIGNWVAVDERQFPWTTIGKALDGSSGTGSKSDHLMTAAEVLAATEMDFEVRKVALNDAETGDTLERLFVTALDRPDGRQYFGAVSDVYEVVQPREALSFFDEVIQQYEGAHYTAAWDMREKSMMGVTIELPDEIVIDPDGRNDRMGMHLLGWNSFDGSTGLAGALDTTRFFCMNQLAPAMKRAKRSFSFRHTKNVRDRVSDAQGAIGTVLDYAHALDDLGNLLVQKTMTTGQFAKFLERVPVFAMPDDATDLVRGRVNERRAEAIAAWEAPHNENITGTRWGALNVVGEYIEWGRNVKGSPRTGTTPERQRAIGTLVHPTVAGTVTTAADILVNMR